MACNCLELAIADIKSQYKMLQCEASRAYRHGDFELAVEHYEKAFFQARLFFRLPQIPPESINYLVNACNHCMEYCYSRCPQSRYLRIAIQETRACIEDSRQPSISRETALIAYIQLCNSLLFRLNREKCLDEIETVLNDIDDIWKKYSGTLLVLH